MRCGCPEAAHVPPENKPWGPGSLCVHWCLVLEDGHARHVVGTVHKLWPWAGGHTRSTQVQPGQTEAPASPPHDNRQLPPHAVGTARYSKAGPINFLRAVTTFKSRLLFAFEDEPPIRTQTASAQTHTQSRGPGPPQVHSLCGCPASGLITRWIFHTS